MSRNNMIFAAIILVALLLLLFATPSGPTIWHGLVSAGDAVGRFFAGLLPK